MASALRCGNVEINFERGNNTEKCVFIIEKFTYAHFHISSTLLLIYSCFIRIYVIVERIVSLLPIIIAYKQ